jgi:hypothetical protein
MVKYCIAGKPMNLRGCAAGIGVGYNMAADEPSNPILINGPRH